MTSSDAGSSSTTTVPTGIPGAPGTTDVPGTPPAGGSTTTPTTPVADAGGGALTPGELAVLRKVATDSDFRVSFAADPIAAITGADLKVTTSDYTRLEKLGEAQLEQVAAGIQALAGAGAMASGLRSEGTNTLLYAIIVALLLA